MNEYLFLNSEKPSAIPGAVLVKDNGAGGLTVRQVLVFDTDSSTFNPPIYSESLIIGLLLTVSSSKFYFTFSLVKYSSGILVISFLIKRTIFN